MKTGLISFKRRRRENWENTRLYYTIM